jgi:hypothetical protein
MMMMVTVISFLEGKFCPQLQSRKSFLRILRKRAKLRRGNQRAVRFGGMSEKRGKTQKTWLS